MTIEFKSEEVEICCTQPGAARIAHGVPCEKKLHRVMATLSGAVTLLDLKAVNPRAHWLEGDRHWQVGVPLAGGKRLVLEPLAYVTREWQKIEAITIIGIMDYHK